MRITYDSEAKAVYIYVTDEGVSVGKSEELQDDIFIDRNYERRINGIEILNVEIRPIIEDITGKHSRENRLRR